MAIAVLMDAEGRVTRFYNGAVICVFEKRNNQWTIVRQWINTSASFGTMGQLREYLKQIAEWMDGCRVLVAEQFIGFYRITFEALGLDMWEADGSPYEILDYIDVCARQNSVAAKTTDVAAEPVENEPGKYSIDLTEVMAHKTALNSRETLLPFLKERKFSQLEVLCGHVPKWLEEELPILELEYRTEEYQDKLKVWLYPKQ